MIDFASSHLPIGRHHVGTLRTLALGLVLGAATVQFGCVSTSASGWAQTAPVIPQSGSAYATPPLDHGTLAGELD